MLDSVSTAPLLLSLCEFGEFRRHVCKLESNKRSGDEMGAPWRDLARRLGSRMQIQKIIIIKSVVRARSVLSTEAMSHTVHIVSIVHTG